MLKAFVECEMYSIIDRLANATSREAVESSLYEALRASRSAKEHGGLCEDVKQERVWVASDESVTELLSILDKDLNQGLETVKRIVLKALSM
jgi:CRISPR type I-A-associated protein Csa5